MRVSPTDVVFVHADVGWYVWYANVANVYHSRGPSVNRPFRVYLKTQCSYTLMLDGCMSYRCTGELRRMLEACTDSGGVVITNPFDQNFADRTPNFADRNAASSTSPEASPLQAQPVRGHIVEGGDSRKSVVHVSHATRDQRGNAQSAPRDTYGADHNRANSSARYLSTVSNVCADGAMWVTPLGHSTLYNRNQVQNVLCTKPFAWIVGIT